MPRPLVARAVLLVNGVDTGQPAFGGEHGEPGQIRVEIVPGEDLGLSSAGHEEVVQPLYQYGWRLRSLFGQHLEPEVELLAVQGQCAGAVGGQVDRAGPD
ncbi:MAG: hypothetical protein ACRD4I_16025, partial [Candidatus Angelobacter sp.]